MSETADEVAAAAAAAAAKTAADKAAADAAAAKSKDKDKSKEKSDALSESLRTAEAEAATLRARLEALAGATPEEVLELREVKRKAAEAKTAADKAAADAEEKRLRESGDFDALRKRINEERDAEEAKSKTMVGELSTALDLLRGQVTAMTMTNAFTGSQFIPAETVFTANKAMKIYGEYFEVEGSTIVGYDAPRGAAKRVKYVDGRGNPQPFDEVIKRIIEADPDRDTVLRSKQKLGAGAVPSGQKTPPVEPKLSGIERIRANLAAFTNKSD